MPGSHSGPVPSATTIRWEKTTAVAVKIKLKRMGKIREPYYRIVVADARTKRDGRAIEEIGKYHPKADPSLIEVNSDRAQHWLSVGAQPTDPVRKLLEVTGDWQKFKGLPGAEGTLRTAAPRGDKKELFAAALAENLAESGTKPKSAPRGKAVSKADAKADDGAAAEGKADKPKTDRGAKPAKAKAETAKPETAKPETAKPETAKADTAKAETAKADDSKASEAKAETAKADTAKADDSKASEAKAETAKADDSKASEAKAERGQGERGQG